MNVFFLCLIFSIFTLTKSDGLTEREEVPHIPMHELWDIETPEDKSTLQSLRFPFTKWCGHGDDAENYDDVGYFSDLDMCCREHDLCPDVIASKKTKYNLTNVYETSRLSCACDDAFHDCLKNMNSWKGWLAGKMYFWAVHPCCFEWDPYLNITKWREGRYY